MEGTGQAYIFNIFGLISKNIFGTKSLLPSGRLCNLKQLYCQQNSICRNTVTRSTDIQTGDKEAFRKCCQREMLLQRWRQALLARQELQRARDWAKKRIIKLGSGEMAQQLREPGFDSQYLQGGLQPSVSPIPGDPVPFSDLTGTRHTHGSHTYLEQKHSSR